MKQQLFEDPNHSFVFNDDKGKWTGFVIAYLTLLTLLLIFSLITLRKIWLGSKSKFGVKIVTSYIVYCVSSIIMMISYLYLRKKLRNTFSNEMDWRLWLSAIITEIMAVVSSIAASYVLWSFGFYYFKVGYKLNYFVKQIPLPPNLNRKLTRLFKSGMAMNIILPTCYAALNSIQIYRIQKGQPRPLPHGWVLYLPYVGTFLMQLLAFVLLLYGVSKIRSLIMQNNKGDLNHLMITLHLVSFGLWMLLVLTIGIAVIGPWKINLSTTVVFDMVGTGLFEVVLGTLLFILYRFAAKEKRVVTEHASKALSLMASQRASVKHVPEKPEVSYSSVSRTSINNKPMLLSQSEDASRNSSLTDTDDNAVEDQIFEQFLKPQAPNRFSEAVKKTDELLVEADN